MTDLFNIGYIDPTQTIYHIQLGIEVTSGYGCVRFNEYNFVSESMPVGIKNSIIDELKLYPNPVTDMLIIGENAQELNELKVYDLLGQQIDIDINANKIDFSKLPSGVYIIKTKTTTHKIVKQ